jgi:hypothetical protein
MKNLKKAKAQFVAASKQYGDANHAITWTAKGLSHLTDAFMEMRRDIDALKRASKQGSR